MRAIFTTQHNQNHCETPHHSFKKESTKKQIMDRGRKAMPVQNKACNQRYLKRCQERHRQKVRTHKKSLS